MPIYIVHVSWTMKEAPVKKKKKKLSWTVKEALVKNKLKKMPKTLDVNAKHTKQTDLNF